jgi:hypothetical protein
VEELEDDVLRSAAGLWSSAIKLGAPKIFDLVTDPAEETNAPDASL